jgi:hypothetical protein
MDWSEWAQQVGGGLINRYADNRWVQPYEIQKMQLQALGQMGYYQEGQASINVGRNGLAISPGILLIGAMVMFVMMSRD